MLGESLGSDLTIFLIFIISRDTYGIGLGSSQNKALYYLEFKL